MPRLSSHDLGIRLAGQEIACLEGVRCAYRMTAGIRADAAQSVVLELLPFTTRTFPWCPRRVMSLTWQASNHLHGHYAGLDMHPALRSGTRERRRDRDLMPDPQSRRADRRTDQEYQNPALRRSGNGFAVGLQFISIPKACGRNAFASTARKRSGAAAPKAAWVFAGQKPCA